MQLYIGNKNYSSWSLRAWLILEKHNVSFDEVKLNLGESEFYRTLKEITPTCKVPTLVDESVVVWDSLAICEYINETYLSGRAWPSDGNERAKARALSAEMHSGFSALRNELPMNIRAKRNVDLSNAAKKDIQRISDIWAEQYNQYGDWLFGEWSIADAMYAPVVHRFLSYGVNVNAEAKAYMDHTLSCESMKKWMSEALEETEIVLSGETGNEL